MHPNSGRVAASIIRDRHREAARDRGLRDARADANDDRRGMLRRLRWLVPATAVAALVMMVIPSALAATGRGDLQNAKASTARFNSVTQASAAGYGLLPAGAPLHECIAATDGPGAMGFHYLNPSLLDTTLDPTAPEVLVYGPDGHGNVKLVALEYVVFQAPWAAEHGATAPALFGRSLALVPEPNRYEVPAFYQLHVWLFEPNPAGLFADFNPTVSCQ